MKNNIGLSMGIALSIGALGVGREWEMSNIYHGGKCEPTNRLSQKGRRKRAKWSKK